MQLVRKVQGKTVDNRGRLCRNCFHVCANDQYLETHQQLCSKFESCHVTLPSSENCAIKFKNYQAKVPLPIVFYFDLESIVVPLDTVANNPDVSYTRQIEKHVPSGFCYAGVVHGQKKLEYFRVHRSENCMKEFIQELEIVARDIHERKQKYRIFNGCPDIPRDQASHCWICESEFDNKDDICLDHCHFSNKFLGWAHSQCNLQRKTQSFVPIIAHNLAGYDLHHVVRNIHLGNRRNLISIIPQTDETYVMLSLKVWIKDIVTKNDKILPIYEELRFIDSFRFISTSLEKIVQTILSEDFSMLDKHFSFYGADCAKLLHGKGFYPYSFMDIFNKFKLKKLPERRNWIDRLNYGNIAITKDDYELAKLIYHRFDCQDMGEYHDLYLTVDTLQLACWFERLRKTCLDLYSLDCAQYVSAPHLAGDAFVKICAPELELLSDRNHLDVAEKLMRGGMSSVYSKRVFTPNNKYLNTFDETKSQRMV